MKLLNIAPTPHVLIALSCSDNAPRHARILMKSRNGPMGYDNMIWTPLEVFTQAEDEHPLDFRLRMTQVFCEFVKERRSAEWMQRTAMLQRGADEQFYSQMERAMLGNGGIL